MYVYIWIVPWTPKILHTMPKETAAPKRMCRDVKQTWRHPNLGANSSWVTNTQTIKIKLVMASHWVRKLLACCRSIIGWELTSPHTVHKWSDHVFMINVDNILPFKDIYLVHFILSWICYSQPVGYLVIPPPEGMHFSKCFPWLNLPLKAAGGGVAQR